MASTQIGNEEYTERKREWEAGKPHKVEVKVQGEFNGPEVLCR